MKKFSEIRGTLKEGKLGKLPDPPPMITMRRNAIRNFPNGLKVALYRNDKLNLDVSVPYYPGSFGDKEIAVALREENEFLIETIVKTLSKIAKSGQPKEITFPDGQKMMVQPSVAASVLKLRSMVNYTNRVAIGHKVSESPKGLKDVFDFTRKEI